MSKLNTKEEEENTIIENVEEAHKKLERIEAFNNITLDFLEKLLKVAQTHEEEPLLALHEINRSINNYLIVNYTASELILEVKKELETTLKNI